jgi:hypothetical protein
MLLLENFIRSRLARARRVAAVSHISNGRVGGNFRSLRVSSSSASTLLINLFFFPYDHIFLILALALRGYILEEAKALIIVCFYMVY